MYIYVIMNRQGHNNIRNGIVWVQTGHNTGTNRIRICQLIPKTPKSFEFISGGMVMYPDLLSFFNGVALSWFVLASALHCHLLALEEFKRF